MKAAQKPKKHWELVREIRQILHSWLEKRQDLAHAFKRVKKDVIRIEIGCAGNRPLTDLQRPGIIQFFELLRDRFELTMRELIPGTTRFICVLVFPSEILTDRC